MATISQIILPGNVVTSDASQVLSNKTLVSPNTSGNINIGGSSPRIIGDFSNATPGSRVMFQTSTVNGVTAVRAIPNGTSQISAIQVGNSSDPANTSYGELFVNGTEVRVGSSALGTGSYLPMTLYTSGSERVRIAIDGTVTFNHKLGINGQAAYNGAWTTSSWTRAISMPVGNTMFWPKGSSSVAKGIGAAGGADNNLYFVASTADDGSVAPTYPFTFEMSAGTLTATGNITAYSDERLKQDWQELPQDFIEQLAQVKHGTYTRTDTSVRQVGVSAQSLQQVLPEAVQDGEYLSVAYGNAALAAVVQLSRRVLELEAKLAKFMEQ